MAVTPRIETFSCDVEPRREAVHVCPVGPLGPATVPLVDVQLRELRIAGFRRLVLDVSRASFAGSAGLRLLERWDAAADADGFAFDVIAAPPARQRRFDVSRLAG